MDDWLAGALYRLCSLDLPLGPRATPVVHGACSIWIMPHPGGILVLHDTQMLSARHRL